MVWQILRLEQPTLRPLLPLLELHIISHQQIHHDRLDLIARKEPARARMSPIPKGHALMIRGSVHGFPGILGIVLTNFFEAQAVKNFWRGVKGRIHGYGLCGDADGGVSGDGEAIREGVGFGDDAFEGYCYAIFNLERGNRGWRNLRGRKDITVY